MKKLQIYLDNSTPTDEYAPFPAIRSTGNAESTSRVLDGSADHGYAQEWLEPATLEDGRKGSIVYLFRDEDLLDPEGEEIVEAENYPWDRCMAHFRLNY